jgi:hypothetical protein
LDSLIKKLNIRKNRFKLGQTSREFTIFQISLHFHELYTALSPFLTLYFQPLQDGFLRAFLKSASIHASLAGKARANDVQSCTTCRTRPVSSASCERRSSGSTVSMIEELIAKEKYHVVLDLAEVILVGREAVTLTERERRVGILSVGSVWKAAYEI